VSATSADTAELPLTPVPVSQKGTVCLGDPFDGRVRELEWDGQVFEAVQPQRGDGGGVPGPGAALAHRQPLETRHEVGSTPRSQLRMARRRARRERLLYLTLGLSLLAGVLAATILTLDMVR